MGLGRSRLLRTVRGAVHLGGSIRGTLWKQQYFDGAPEIQNSIHHNLRAAEMWIVEMDPLPLVSCILGFRMPLGAVVKGRGLHIAINHILIRF